MTCATAPSSAAALARLAQPIEHHLDRQDRGDGVDLILPGVFRRRAVRGLEHGQLGADVARAAEAEAADHLGAQVGNDVAVEVGRDQHVVVEGVLQQPHRHGVNVGVVHLDFGEVLGHGLGGFQEQPVGGAHDVGLVDDGDLLALVLAGELEGGADDALRAGPGIDLAGDGVLVQRDLGERGERLGELAEHVRQLLGHGRELDPGIQVLRVLAVHHQVNALLEVERVAGVAFARAQADVEVEQLPHAHDGRAVGQALVLQRGRQLGGGGLGRLGGDRAEQRGIHVLQQLDRAGREGVALPCTRSPSRYRRGCIPRRGGACRAQSSPPQGHPRRCRRPAARQSCIWPYSCRAHAPLRGTL